MFGLELLPSNYIVSAFECLEIKNVGFLHKSLLQF